MKAHYYISSYLAIKPLETSGRSHWQRRLHNRIIVLWRARPHLSRRTGLALTIWMVIFGIGLQTFSGQKTLPRQSTIMAANNAVGNALLAAQAGGTAALPTGPSGQLLPPGTMAPAYTYANRYARGQCTWYVAGRRPIPANWGNARSWYAAAQRAGWATGTTPAVAAIAWTPAGYYGHVALVEGVDTSTGRVLISEMNHLGPYRTDQRWVAINDFKYIY